MTDWHYDDLRRVGVDFEDTAAVDAYDRNQRLAPSRIAPSSTNLASMAIRCHRHQAATVHSP